MFLFFVGIGYFDGYTQTAKAPAKKTTITKPKSSGNGTGSSATKLPGGSNKTAAGSTSGSNGRRNATKLPAGGSTKTATGATSGSNATKLPAGGSTKTAAGSASSDNVGSNATKLPAGGTTTSPTQQPRSNSYSSTPQRSSSNRSSSSYSSSSRRSTGYGFSQGNHLLNIGLGLGYNGYYSRALPIGASYEYGIHPDISVGAQLDFAWASYYSSYYYYNSYYRRYWATYIGARGSYHFNRILSLDSNKFDLYAGAGIGYRNYSGYYYYYSPIHINFFAGGKLYFSKSVGGFLELGYTGLSYTKIGVSIKL